MAEAKGDKPGNGTGAAGTPVDAAASAAPVRLRNVWPLPALVIGGGLLVGGAAVLLMGRPKPLADVPLEQAKALVEERRYQEAIEKLNSKEVRSYLDFGSPDSEHMRAYYLAMARAFEGAQATLGLNKAENHKVIVESFEKAEKEGKGAERELDPSDVSRMVESLIALDSVEGEQGALARIGKLPESEHARRTRLTRSLVEHNLAIAPALPSEKAVKRADQTLELLAGLSADPAIAAEDKAWVLARQGEILIAAGRPDEAVNKLIRRVGLLKDVARERQGELYVLLGKAYFQQDQPLNAMRQLEAADGLLEKASPLRADLGVMLGRLAQSGVSAEGMVGHGVSENDPTAMLEFAREKFEGVIGEFASNRQYARAELGVAEVEAALRHDDKSLEKYAELVDLLKGGGKKEEKKSGVVEGKGEGTHEPKYGSEGAGEVNGVGGHGTKPEPAHGPGMSGAGAAAAAKGHVEKAGPGQDVVEPGAARVLGDVTRESVATSLMQRFHERFDSGQRESALRYADVAETLFKDADVPAEVLLAIGATRRALGDHAMSAAKEQHAADLVKGSADFSVEDLDAATRAEVKKNYIVAGDYLRRHAKSVATTEPGVSASSLWQAADSYDRAGDMEEAKKAFSDYAETASDTDPNRAEARFRLGQVFQARHEYGAAIALYKALIEAGGADARASGTVADKAIVPLAQCMLADNDPTNNEEAERYLLGVVDGSRVRPEASAFRAALIELGNSCYRQERFAEAIGWLEQAAKRYKDDKRIEGVRYLLADSHRREAVKIGRTLGTQRMPQAQTDLLERSRVEHLRTARTLYDAVRGELRDKDPRTQTKLERTHLRNAYFSIGDCAMEMKDYDAAIGAYDEARLKYSDDPASLVAMAQIVSAYAAQEKWPEARTANERARQQLAKFPESVWQMPDLPMEKRHWERWLDARTLIAQQATGESEK